MATHGRGLVCLAMTPERLDALEIPLEVPVNSSLRDTAMCVSIDARGKTQHRHLGGRSRGDHPHGARPGDAARRTCCGPGHVFPLRARERRRAGARRPHRSGRRSGADRRPHAGRRHLRDHEQGRHDGARAGADEVREAHGLLIITIADLIKHRMRTRAAGAAGRVGRAADRVRRVPRPRLREPARRRDARGARARRDRRRPRRAGARALEVPDRRRVPLGALRLRRAARHGDAAHRRRRTAACCCI